MSRAIERRVAAAERRFSPRPSPIRQIVISGGLSKGIAPIASVGSSQFQMRAEPDETFGTFRARVLALARTERATLVIFGGLPDTPFDYEYADAQDDLKLRKLVEQSEDQVVPDEEII
jgi:hypothetical protein